MTKTAVADPTFTDPGFVWGEKRCYVVRTAEKVDEAVVESAASPEVCVTPVDTFPPAAPKALQSIASVGAITLIWEPNAERDLAGYIVLRGGGESDLLQQPRRAGDAVRPSAQAQHRRFQGDG